MKRFLSFAVCCIAVLAVSARPVQFSDSTRRVLQQLDRTLRDKDAFREQLEARIAVLKDSAAHSAGAARIGFLKHIFEAYSHVQTDSATHYIGLIAHSPEAVTDLSLQNYVCIGRAQVFAVMGLYDEAFNALSHCVRSAFDTETQLFYYRTVRTLYGWMAEYAANSASFGPRLALTEAYRDSILLLEPEGEGRDVVLADAAIARRDARTALHLCQQNMAGGKEPMVYTLYLLAECYRLTGNSDLQVRFLARTAQHDIESGIAEYKALPELAQLLFENGDVERAYNYLISSIEDANYCKARLRAVEATNVFPIVDKAYKELQRQRRKTEMALLFGLGALVVLLATFILLLRRQMRKRSQLRRQLAATNEELQRMNDELKQVNADLLLTDKMKEEYIARYLSLCRSYIDTLDDYRRELLRLARAGQHDELLKRLKSEDLVAKEQKRFYGDFDRAFISLFPYFIERFNDLLEPDARTYPKKNEVLNTELRIFALVRLGITESNRIAHFLDYSLATIYNYRSKFRNHALCGKDEFERRVAAL